MLEKISLAGDLGSGKSTVAKIVIPRLGMEYFSTGVICRAIAVERGIDVENMNIYMEQHPEIDLEIDNRLKPLSDDPRPLLIDSRMAWHFVRDTFRVYMSTEPIVSAQRIFGAGRAEERFSSVEEADISIRSRRASESKRYMQFYGVDNRDLGNYDLILDSTYATPEEIADYMIDAYEAWRKNKETRACYISPLRLYYPDEREEGESRPDLLAERIEAGERPLVDVQFDGERFCVVSDPDVALGYSLSSLPFVPCRLLPGKPAGNFVRMSDTL